MLTLCTWSTSSSAQSTTAAIGVVRHAFELTGSNRIEGSVQILTGETMPLSGNAIITGDLLVPGTPSVRLYGNPSYGGTVVGAGSELPSNYEVGGNGSFSLRHVVLRTNPAALPSVTRPPAPAGTRDVTVSAAGQSAGNFSTIRNLSVEGKVGNVVVPPGTYGSFSVTGKNSLTLGIPGAKQPAIYNFQQLVFTGNDDVRIVGPVIVTVNSTIVCGGRIGSRGNPGWLRLRVASGNVVLSGNNTIYGEVIAPSGTVHFNGNSELIGGLKCDRLVLIGNNLLRFLVLNAAPAAINQLISTDEDVAAAVVLTGTDPENSSLTFTLLSHPQNGTLTGAAPNLFYLPNPNYHGSDSFTFKASDGEAESNVATVTIAVTAVNDVPVADSQAVTTEEELAVPFVLSAQDVDGDPLNYRVVTGPSNGTISGIAPQLVYTPSSNFNGLDQITFVANDGSVDSVAATISINVGPVNDAPVAVDQPLETDEDTALPLLLEALDADGDALTFRVVGPPQHGTLTGTPPNLTYTPAADYYGTDVFTFRASDSLEDSSLATVTVIVRPINDPPIANEQNVTATEDTARAIVLTGSDIDSEELGFAIVLPPSHGVLTGTPPDLVYTPERDYNGPDSFTFRVADGFAVSNVATVVIDIERVNDAPVATAQTVETAEDVELPVSLTAADVEDDPLSYAVIEQPQHGMLRGSAPDLTYIPNANYHGPDSFLFHVSDGIADSEAARVQVTVTAVNDTPVANNQSVTTDEDTAREVILTGSDIDGDALTYRVVDGPTKGTLTGTAPQLTYAPGLDYAGPDAFTFVVSDGLIESAVATVAIEVGPVNDAPVTYDENVSTNEDAALPFILWANEYDGDAVTFTITTAPQHGTISGVPPRLTYTPRRDYHGPDSFAFKANDGLEDSNTSTYSVVVHPVNDVPVAAAQVRITPEDSVLPITLTAEDIDGDPISYKIVRAPTNGVLSGTPPDLTYTPSANYNGPDLFMFQANDGTADSNTANVAITVQPVNDLPQVVPQNLATDEETPVQVTLSGSDVDADALTFLILTAPEHGTLTGTPPQLVYTPSPDYAGPDHFVFAANDGTSDSLPAQVQITVRPLNDAPVAHAQSVSTTEDTALDLVLGATDGDADPLTYTITLPPEHGSVTGALPNLTYVPAGDYNGADRFAFEVNDGRVDSAAAVVQIAIMGVNDAPSAATQAVTTDQNISKAITLAGSDVDQDALTFAIVAQPGHGVLTGTAPDLVYVPAENYHGPDSFTFLTNDGTEDSAVATVSITVNKVNRRPIAAEQSITTEEDTPRIVTLTGADADGDPLTYIITSNPTNGRLLGSGASITYRPNTNFAGADSFSFKVNDGAIDSLPAAVTVTVTALNDVPVANAQTIATKQDQAKSIVLTGTDPDGDAITYALVDVPSNGTLSGTVPNLTYTPATAYLGSDRFTFRVNDGTADSALATVNINVNATNTAPSALPQSVGTDEDQPVNVTLAANDAEGNTLAYRIVSQPTNGTLSGTAPAFTYTPAENYNGSDRFTFVANDGTLDSNAATVSVSVRPINDAPVPAAQSIRTKQGIAKSFILGGSDLDGDALTYIVTAQPANGTLNGTPPNLTYTPYGSFYGADSIKFVVTDGKITSGDAVVSVKVTPPVLGRTYTTSADFAEGNLFNVSSSHVPDQLQTSIDQSNFDFVWIPIFTKGTVVRLDSDTGRVLGEYRLTPDGVGAPYASRTAIDSKGNCWIANERTNTVVMIANPAGTDWIDKNRNGKLDTSAGQNDVRAWLNAAGVDTNGGVSTAEDELIVRYVKTTATNIRHLSVDAQDNVWVGGVGVQNFDLIDGKTGTIIRTEASNGRGGNGGFIDFDNVLWSTGSFLRWATGVPLSSVPRTPWDIPENSWAAAKDPFGNVWVTYDPSTHVFKYAPDGQLIGAYPHGYSWSQGLAIDANGDVWIATSHCGYSVSHLKNDGTFVGSIPVAAHGPTGVAIDRKGRIWVSSTTGVVERIDPRGGEIGADGVTPIGALDLTSSYLGGTIWAYSNFTGAAIARDGQRGRWTVTYDSEQDGARWGPVVWNAALCNDGAITVYAALSEDGINYAPEQLLTPGNSTPSGTGRFITVRVDFDPSQLGGDSPVLYDLSVGVDGYVPPPVAHGWTLTAGEDISAKWPDPLVLRAAICRSAYDAAINTQVTWEVVSGPGQVSFSDVHAMQPTCNFTEDGTYVFRVTATAGDETQTDEVTVRLTPYNKAPWVSAGHNKSSRTLEEPVLLNGVVRDDGLPENVAVQSLWKVKYGPGTAIFADPAQAQTTATFSQAGIYTLELSATDGEYSATSTVEIRVAAFCNIGKIDGLVSWWQANGTGADHGSGNEAFLEAGATYDNGKVGAAFKFDGTNDRAIAFKSPSLDVGKNGSMTIEFWANTANRGTEPMLLGWHNGTGWGVHIYQRQQWWINDIRAAFVDTAGVRREIAVGQDHGAINGQWRHYAVTYDRATGVAKFYVNGVQITQSNLGSFTPQTGHDLYFGHVQGSDRPPFAGMLDEVGLYSRALDGQEIWEIYAADADGKCPINENAAPTVSAGPEQSIAEDSGTTTLFGSASDDGLPVGSSVAVQWTKVSGPGNVTFANANAVETAATLDAPGIYVLKLSADDTLQTVSDTVEVRVGSFCHVETPPGLAAWWPAQGNSREAVGWNDGRLLNGIKFATGKTSLGFSFDGADDSVRVPATSSLDIAKAGDGSMTIEFWAQTLNRGNEPMLLGWHNGSGWGVHIYQRQQWFINDVRAAFVDSSGVHREIAVGQDHAAINGLWRHYAVTYDKPSGIAKFYINGVQQTQSTLGNFTAQTSYDMYLGYMQGSNRPAFAGMLDEVSLYTRALDGQEIYEIFAADKDGKCPVAENQAPSVSAGADQSTAAANGTVTVSGSVEDDGLPAGSTVRVQWSKLHGPGDVQFGSPNSLQTPVQFNTSGIYVLQLTADDTLARVSDTVEVRVGTFCNIETPVDGLAAWWPGQGNGRDVIGSNDGRLLNGISFGQAKVSLGFNFDGANDGVRVPAAPSLDIAKAGDGSMTIEFWAQTLNRGNEPLLLGWHNGSAWGVHVYQRQQWFINDMRFAFVDTAGVRRDIALGQDHAAINGQWRHYAVTYDRGSGIAKLYLNGVQQQQASWGSFTPQTSSDLFFGHVHGSDRSPFAGSLDEVGLYTRALDGQEVFDIYRASAEGKCPLDSNHAPIVDAGPNQSLVETNRAITLYGTLTDDGLPVGAALSAQWTQLDGPGQVTFANPNAPETTASFSLPGIYVLQLSANDTLNEASDTVEVRVNAFCSVDDIRGLAAWWPANGSPRDVISGQTGRLLNGVGFAPARASMGFAFDGENDAIRVPAAPNLDVGGQGDGSMTIEFWANTLNRGNEPMLLGWHNGTGWGVHIYQRQQWFINDVRAAFVDTTGVRREIAVGQDHAAIHGQWRHYAVTYDRASGLARFFINGVQQAQSHLGNFTPQTSHDLYLGLMPWSDRPAFSGVLDEISLYTRALDGKEIYDIYAAGAEGKCPIDDNASPLVNAGPDQSIPSVHSVATLRGSISDDGLPAGSAIAAKWSKVAGPGGVTFGTAEAAQTTATFTAPGIYVLQLLGHDGLDEARDMVEVRVAAFCGAGSPTGLIGWWPGNGNAVNAVSGDEGRVLNAMEFAPAKVSLGFNFDGVDDSVRIPSTPASDVANAGDGSMTIEFWSNTANRGTEPVLLGWHNGVGWGVHVYQHQQWWINQLRAVFIDTAGVRHEVIAGENHAAVDGQWRHYAATYDRASGIGRLYIDGVQQAQAQLGSFTPQTSYDLYFGSKQSSGKPAFTGLLDEISLYNRALDGQEIHNIFVAGADGKCPVDQNQPPAVNAGQDARVPAESGEVTLRGSVSDDGLPVGATLGVRWSKMDGPGNVTFADADALETTATFDTPGTYVLELTADDSLARVSDTTEVRVGAQCTVDQPDGLSAWWTANGTVTDVVAGQTARLLNGTNFAKGQVSLGFNFDGVNDSVRVPAAPALDLGTQGDGSITIEFWSKTLNHGNEPVLLGWHSGSTWGVHIYQRQQWFINDLRVAFIDTTGARRDIAFGQDHAAIDGQLRHYAVTYDRASGIARLYVNGAQQAQTPLGSFIPQTSYDLYFGSMQTSGSPAFAGMLDEISMYSRALTAAEIQAVYAAGACGKTPFVRNVAPVVNAGSDRTITLPTNTAILSGTAVDDGLPANGTLTASWTQTSGAAATLSSTSTLQTLATFPQPGEYTFQLTANDGELSTSSVVRVTVLADLRTPPTIALTAPAEASRYQTGQTITLSANAADGDGRIAKVAFFAGGAQIAEDTIAPYSFAWTNASGGSHALTAIATDNDALTATSGAINIHVVDPTTEPAPKIEFSTPEDAAVITAPTEFRGSVEMASLKSWRLDYQLQGTACQEWITFASGTGPVREDALGTLDTTMLLNGTYSVRLVVTDLANVTSWRDTRTFFVDGNMKVGQFSATFKDLELPLSGVPITVTRTYDSRNKCPGDFGYGWTLDVDSIRLESSEPMGDSWSQFIFVGNLSEPSYYRLDDAGPHLVSVKMPDGQLLRFTPKLVMDRPYNRLASLPDGDGDDVGQVYSPIQTDDPLKLIYRARPGTEGATLKPRGYRTNESTTINGDAQLFLEDNFEGAIRLATRPAEFFEAPVITDVTGWELTLRDGRVLLFDAEGKLEELRDRVGNKVAFIRASSGKIERISHSPSGKEVVFARDAADRIKSITDPAGNAVQYRYTTSGDLDAFFERGNDPAASAPTTRFTYKGATHLLEDILDARGVRAAKNYYDDSGRLERTVDAEGKETVFTHDVNSRTETIKDRAGNVTVHKYDERGNVIETRSPDGTVTATDYHRWSDGKLSELKETETVTGLFTDESNPAGPLVTKTLTTRYSYEDDDPNTPAANDGLLRKLVDPKGHTTTFSYDERGNVLTVTDAKANAGTTPAASVINTYYANGLLETATDAVGNVTTYTYDAKGNPDTETRSVTLTNADGTTTVANVVTDRDYNTLGQLEKVTDATGHATTFEYDTNGNRRFERTTRTTSSGAVVAVVTETEYDEQDRPVRVWNADNPRSQAARPSSRTVYDGNGKVEWTYDSVGRGTHQEYNTRGLLFRTTHPDGTSETVTYDAEGRREISYDRRGMATKTVYDAMGRVIQTVFLGDGSTAAVTLSSTRYDAAGRVWQTTDANNNTTTYAYDDSGRRTAVVAAAVSAAGVGTVTPITRYQYDANGNLRFVTDAKNRITEHVYDALNRRTKTILPAAQLDVDGDGLFSSSEQSVVSSIITGYDELGRRTSETDASNRTKRFGYDVLGRLRHVLDFAGQATRFEYDELGNQLSQTDANNHTTRYSYDNAGRRETRTLPLGQQEVLGYDGAGNLESRRDFNGRVTTFGYDAMNRLRFKVPDSAFGEPTIEFTYNKNGQRETMSDATGTTVYGYDGRGQLETKRTPFGTLSYTYHPGGSLKSMASSNANGVSVGYSYDTHNRLTTVADGNLGNTTYTYDEVGNLKQVLYPNNVKHLYNYNALNRLELLIDRNPANTIINCWRYRATPAGQRTWVEEFDKRTAWYGYDNLGRLKTETVTGSIKDGKNGVVTYGYDNVGNRLTRSSSLGNVTNQSFGYDSNDRLNGDTHDSNGNTVTSTNLIGTAGASPAVLGAAPIIGTDTYDSDNRLTTRTGANGSNITLVYDGDGNRVQEIVNGQVKSYLVDDRNPTGYAQVVEEIVNGVVNHTYVFGHDLISQDQVDPATNSWKANFYGYDGRGTVRFLTDETGAVTDTYTYDAFGTLITATGSTANRYLYSGEQFDPNLGLYYLRARLMNPLTGRFWTQDTYEGDQSDPASLHKYVYANLDPANGSDPTGRFTLSDVNSTSAIANMSSALQPFGWALPLAPKYFLTRAIFGAVVGETMIDYSNHYLPETADELVKLSQSLLPNRRLADKALFLATDLYALHERILRQGIANPLKAQLGPVVNGYLLYRTVDDMLDRLTDAEETVTEAAQLGGVAVTFEFRKWNVFWRVALFQADPADDVRAARALVEATKSGNLQQTAERQSELRERMREYGRIGIRIGL